MMDPFEMKEAMKVYAATDKPKYPDFVKKTDNWGTLPDNGLYKAYAVYECPNDKLHDALKAIMKRYTYYASNVSSYSYQMEVLYPEADLIQIFTEK